ncbi:EscU/YscU/HrcU family type III secretion system export apparatus switch protein [unidentified bacterial endosymbiont]|jgi:type III secretion system export apparatus switch protein|uniref:EscU/YscU/HrcU family type III secretion system export apparatus switch protein n=1 Tax=unidentified bacterial endosymbiont TaxID=2355 RepID=UPI00209D6C6C|nr:EscU/YscU/HrcU family type III secretion system export apparatus switch protein [unidentified bacterial endosymbiont]
MAGNKTEKPTQKKIKDSAKKGKSFKSRDLIVTCMILAGVEYIVRFIRIDELMFLWQMIIDSNFTLNLHDYARVVFLTGGKIFLPFLLLCICASALPSLLQTGFVMAGKALKLNFDALNPVNGIKKIFSLRTAKDFVKACLFLSAFVWSGWYFWNANKVIIFSQTNGTPLQIIMLWGGLFRSLVLTCLVCVIVILVVDALVEYFLHIKDLKMDKQEVKREYKDQEGDPEIKSRRKGLHAELLSEQVKSDVKNSKVIIVNPTHVAVGIYFNPDVVGLPFISVLETNQRALAVRRYAEKSGVPVFENVALARRILKTHRRYSFINMDEIDEVIKIIIWLEQVENAWMHEQQSHDIEPHESDQVSSTITQENDEKPRDD